ncbi:hypothetical protein [Clostridium estertheticum]|uniref:Uncharacterized protein n=1 Tax=Clostridium estertheticum TaxID=238834 RepID=A0AA47ELS9_9CLOT|nr:hypothetical protein [Clostridium estertheticum]MBU3157845.1 hypothetical protein [Clostridium estertheticum]WAG62593.1 hypothetical protein LL038_10285 [Clostridium estertheticum]
MNIDQYYKNLVNKKIENKINNKIIIDIFTFTICLGLLIIALISMIIYSVMFLLKYKVISVSVYFVMLFIFIIPSIIALSVIDSIDILKDLSLNDKTFAYIYFFNTKVNRINENGIFKYLYFIDITFARRYVNLNLSKIRDNLSSLFIYTDEDSIIKSNLIQRIRVVLSSKTIFLIKKDKKQLILDLLDCLLNLYGIVLTLIANNLLTELEKKSQLAIEKKLLSLLSEIETLALPTNKNKNIIEIISKLIKNKYFILGVLLMLTLIIIYSKVISGKSIEFISLFGTLITIWLFLISNNQNKPKE